VRRLPVGTMHGEAGGRGRHIDLPPLRTVAVKTSRPRTRGARTDQTNRRCKVVSLTDAGRSEVSR